MKGIKVRFWFLDRHFPAAPSYQNVIPAGAGWYRFEKAKWRFVDACTHGPNDRHLSDNDLLRFALDAGSALRERKGGES